ncbi:hypothetical protein LINPERPRIM_LOCUS11017 [Linum perenne]
MCSLRCGGDYQTFPRRHSEGYIPITVFQKRLTMPVIIRPSLTADSITANLLCRRRNSRILIV